MKISLGKVCLFVVTAAALLLSGCSFSVNLGNTTPTSLPPAVVVSPVTGQETTPTESAASTEASSGTSAYTLSTTQFILPSKAFAVYPPEGWENQQKDSEIEVAYISPDGSVVITTEFTNTGYTLDTTALENYIDGNQANIYSGKSNYSEQSRELHLDQGYGMVYVTFDYNNVPQKVERLYQQDGNVIFETEFWADADKWDQNVDFFNKYLDGLTYNGSNVKNYEPYMFVNTYTNVDNLFSFDYLRPWNYVVNKTTEKYGSSESLWAPDSQAVIDILYFNDYKTYWSKGVAGQWAISSLESGYSKGSGDLKIDKDQMNENGYEQLNWHSIQNKETGITVFTAKDTRIALVTVAWANSSADVYQSSLEYTITTFVSPAK